MGRKPKNQPPVEDGIDLPPEPTDQLPPRMVDGKPNPSYFRRKYEILNDRAEEHYVANGEYPKGLDTALRSLERECQLAGIDPKGLHDTRSEIDKALDLLRQVADTPESVFEAMETDIAALQAAMDKSQTLVKEYIDGLLTKAEREYAPIAGLPKASPGGEESSPESSSSRTEPEVASPSGELEANGPPSPTLAITKPDTSSGT